MPCRAWRPLLRSLAPAAACAALGFGAGAQAGEPDAAALFHQQLLAAAHAAQKATDVKVTFPQGWPSALQRKKLFAASQTGKDWFVLIVSETAGCADRDCALSYIHGWKASKKDISLASDPAIALGHGVLGHFEPAGYSSSRQSVDNAQLHFWHQGAWYEIDADLSRDGKYTGPAAERVIMLALARSAVERLASRTGAPFAGNPLPAKRRP
jgi:hypothetical protein